MVLFFLGGYSILLGISFLRDMILWKNIMGNTYLWYYIEFAFTDAPVFYVGICLGIGLIATGIISCSLTFIFIKKCSWCGKRVFNYHKFCRYCGEEIEQNEVI